MESLATIKQTESHLACQVWWCKSSRAVNRPQDVFEMRQHGRRGLLKTAWFAAQLAGNQSLLDCLILDLGDHGHTIQPDEARAFSCYHDLIDSSKLAECSLSGARVVSRMVSSSNSMLFLSSSHWKSCLNSNAKCCKFGSWQSNPCFMRSGSLLFRRFPIVFTQTWQV